MGNGNPAIPVAEHVGITEEIPTTEVQIVAQRSWNDNRTKIRLIAPDAIVPARKTSSGMHLVFRYLRLWNPQWGDQPRIQIRFSAPDRAKAAFKPVGGNHDFVDNGFELGPGEWRTIEVEEVIGLATEPKIAIPIELIKLPPPAMTTSPPDGAEVDVYC